MTDQVNENDRSAMRQVFIEAWQRHHQALPLTPLQQQLVDIMLMHPEYHDLLAHPEQLLTAEYRDQDNPFLHMALHMSVLEQIATDRPPGINQVYQALLHKSASVHDAQHKIMSVLQWVLAESQQLNQPPSEVAYLERLRKMVR